MERYLHSHISLRGQVLGHNLNFSSNLHIKCLIYCVSSSGSEVPEGLMGHYYLVLRSTYRPLYAFMAEYVGTVSNFVSPFGLFNY